jgi:hypothetical protein
MGAALADKIVDADQRPFCKLLSNVSHRTERAARVGYKWVPRY